jgi:aromatic amino acid aminotransferase I
MIYVSNMVSYARKRDVNTESLTETDIIICEDDPYSFLQFPSYTLGEPSTPSLATPAEYLSSLAPSFLELDTQGRVIRLDTFSKVLCFLLPLNLSQLTINRH